MEYEKVLAADPNNADANASASFWKVLSGRAEDGFAGIEKALRLSPRDPAAQDWQFYMCHLHSHLAHWRASIDWCSKSAAGRPKDW